MVILKKNFILYLPYLSNYNEAFKGKFNSYQYLLFQNIKQEQKPILLREIERLKNASNVLLESARPLVMPDSRKIIAYSLDECYFAYANSKVDKTHGIYITLERLKKIDFIYYFPYKNLPDFHKNENHFLQKKEKITIEAILKNIF